MTRKDYIGTIYTVQKAYARSVSLYPIMKGYIDAEILKNCLIGFFENDNVRFNPTRFITAYDMAIKNIDGR